MHSAVEQIEQTLRNQGNRITAARHAILEIFFGATHPLPASDVLAALEKQGMQVNKSTVYREIDFLVQENIIHEIGLPGERQKRYEPEAHEHHHHIRCIKCNTIADVTIPDDLDAIAKHIQKQTGFTVDSHALEFTGLCPKHGGGKSK